MEPMLPCWRPDGSDVCLSDVNLPGRYKVNGVFLFEFEGAHRAFLLIWGSAPHSERAARTWSGWKSPASRESVVSERPWWKSEGGYFCWIVDWERFAERPYRKEDLDLLTSDWRSSGSSFGNVLMLFCSKELAGQSLKTSMSADVGSREPGAKTEVTAGVSGQGFLGVDGVVVEMVIGRRHDLLESEP